MLAVCLLLELSARQQAAGQRLPDRHDELVGLELVRDVDNGSSGRGGGDAVPLDGRYGILARARVHDDSWGPAQAPVAARDKKVHRVGDVIAEGVQPERAGVRDDRLVRADRKPCLADLVVFAARESAEPVKAAPASLEPAAGAEKN